MSNYNTNLEAWGSTGSVYPTGYSHLEGEQPVDDWDNFFKYNTIEDIDHLIELTNKRFESGSGVSFPTSPDSSHAFYRSDDERLYTWNSTQGQWDGLLKSNGDSLSGDLDLDGHVLKNVGQLSLTGKIDLANNDLRDSVSGTLLYDSSSGSIPLDALEQSNITLNTGSHISGGQSIKLGSSTSISVDDDFVLNTGDVIDGELTAKRSTDSRHFTAMNTDTGDKLSIRNDSSGSFQLVGYDDSSGSWDYADSMSYNPGTGVWEFGSLPAVDGNSIATQTWVSNNIDQVDYALDSDTVDGVHASGLAKLGDGVQNPIYSSLSDVPNSITKGEIVHIDGDGLYMEDGN